MKTLIRLKAQQDEPKCQAPTVPISQGDGIGRTLPKENPVSLSRSRKGAHQAKGTAAPKAVNRRQTQKGGGFRDSSLRDGKEI